MAELSRQLLFAPPDKRIEQVRRAEALHDSIDCNRNYPFEFISYRITGYRSDGEETALLVGEAVLADLRQLIDELSRSVGMPADDTQPAVTVQQLARRLNVSTKTIGRYRQAGLRWRWVAGNGRKMRLGITEAAITHFLSQHGSRVQRASSFTQLNHQARAQLLRRARRLAQGRDLSLHRVATHLAGRTGRAVETIRQLLEQHERQHPASRIFLTPPGPLTPRQKRLIARAYGRGISVPRIAEHVHRTRSTVYRALREARVHALREREISYIANPTFDRPDADEVILAPLPNEYPTPRSTEDGNVGMTPIDDLPQALAVIYDQPLLPPAAQRRLIVRYNYLKFKAAQLRDRLDPYEPRVVDLDAVERYLTQAQHERDRLVAANLPIVLALARRHLVGQAAASTAQLADLLELGQGVLFEVLEQYDAPRSGVFEAYLRWRLLRGFAAAQPRAKQAHRKVRDQELADRLRRAAARFGVRLPGGEGDTGH